LSIHNVVADVAKGYIVQPLSRTFHYTPMPEHMFRVEVVWVILGYEDQYPLVPPADPDEDTNLGGCLGSVMLWTKALIRLDSSSTSSESGRSQPRFTPTAMVPAFGMADPADPPPKPHFIKKRDPIDDDHHDHAPDLEAPGDDVDHEAPSDDVDIMSKASKLRLFKSHEMPEAAPYTEDQTAGRPSFLTRTHSKGSLEMGWW
jgi:hypothetical protein